MQQFFRWISWIGVSCWVVISLCLMTQRPVVSDRKILNNPVAKALLAKSRLQSRSAANSSLTSRPPRMAAAANRKTLNAKGMTVGKGGDATPSAVAFNSGARGDNSASSPSTESLPSEPRLVINLGRRQVSLYQEGGRRKNYPIAVGRPGWETPIGEFRVMDMRQNPTWINPFTGKAISPQDPRNPLGGYWIGFWTDGRNWIGFHGTPNTDSVGSAASHGCVRMYRQDIAELFAQVTPGMPVIVQP